MGIRERALLKVREELVRLGEQDAKLSDEALLHQIPSRILRDAIIDEMCKSLERLEEMQPKATGRI